MTFNNLSPISYDFEPEENGNIQIQLENRELFRIWREIQLIPYTESKHIKKDRRKFAFDKNDMLVEVKDEDIKNNQPKGGVGS